MPNEVSHYSGRQAGHKGWQHDKGGKVFMDDFHRKKAACHRRIEGGGKSGPRTTADEGPSLHIGVTEEFAYALTCHTIWTEGPSRPMDSPAPIPSAVVMSLTTMTRNQWRLE